MSDLDIIRAWKDPAYRQSLSEAEFAELPAHPIGPITLSVAELDQVVGGLASPTILPCGPSQIVTICNC